MLLKKIIIGIFFLAAGCQQAFANDFYIGGGVGASSNNDEQKTTTQGQAPITHDLGATGVSGSVLGGYEFDFNNKFNLGLEPFFTIAPQKITLGQDPPSETLPDRKAEYSLRYAYGIRALPGYKIQPNVTGYAIVGVVRGSFSLKDSGAYSCTSTRYDAFGYELGLGSSIALLKNLDARLDFTYTQYARHTTDGISTYGSLAGNPMSYRDSPSSFSAMFVLVYKFLSDTRAYDVKKDNKKCSFDNNSSDYHAFANNFYIGAGIGATNCADTQLITAPAAPSAAPTTHDYSGVGLLGSWFAGCNMDLFKRFNLGLEFFFTESNNQIGVDDISVNPATLGQPITSMKISQKYAYGVRMLPGYKITPDVDGHLIIGYSRGTFRLRDDGAYALAETDFGVNGLQYGLGFSVGFWKNLALRLDFIYTQYPHEHYTTSGPLPSVPSPGNASYYDSLSTLDGVLSLTCKF